MIGIQHLVFGDLFIATGTLHFVLCTLYFVLSTFSDGRTGMQRIAYIRHPPSSSRYVYFRFRQA